MRITELLDALQAGGFVRDYDNYRPDGERRRYRIWGPFADYAIQAGYPGSMVGNVTLTGHQVGRLARRFAKAHGVTL